jgi:hypothetical protein
MALSFARTPPLWFYIVAALITLWGAMGCYACYLQVTLGAEAMGPATDYDRALYASLPGWYNLVYAVAVGSGLLGGIALLFRKRAARMLFIVSMIAVVVQFGFLFLMTDIIAAKGAGVVLPFPMFILAASLVEIWFAGRAGANGWLR